MLEGSSKVNSGALTTELSAGDSDSVLQITFVSNPICKPCIRAHQVISELSKDYPGYIYVKYRFSLNKDDIDSISYRVVHKVLAIMLSSTQRQALDALSAWLNMNMKLGAFEDWDSSYNSSISASSAKVNQLMVEHVEWCKLASISATPTLFINDHKVPEEYSVEDVRYHISNWLVPADVISHGSVSENEKEIAPGVACPPL
jgi:protein-disulfide isomerase